VVYGHALGVVGRHEEALRLLDAAIAAARSTGAERYVLMGELERSTALMRARRVDESKVALDTVWTLLETAHGDAQQYALAFMCHTQILLANSRLSDAEAAVNQALERLGYPEHPLGSGARSGVDVAQQNSVG
jgi:hypothetical protein